MRANRTRPVIRFGTGGGLDHENRLFEELAGAGRPADRLVFWQQPRSLIVPRRWKNRPGVEYAAAEAEAAGWPVLFRSSGGACVFHGDNVLCVTRILSVPPGTVQAPELYRAFAGDLGKTARQLGVGGCRTGQAPLAPCDGRFNLLVGDRKLAGLAMRRRLHGGMETLLVHACLWLSGPLRPALEAIETFERGIGLPSEYPSSACISLAEAMGATAVTDDGLAELWAGTMDRPTGPLHAEQAREAAIHDDRFTRDIA